MIDHSPLMAIVPDESLGAYANQLATSMGLRFAQIVTGGPLAAIPAITDAPAQPTYLLIDIGDREFDVLAELDALAEHCEPGVKVVVVGAVNDVRFYRELKQRGITEYFTRPVNVADVRNALMQDTAKPKAQSQSTVITFTSAASGDGSSTIALNTAYAIAQETRKSTVLIDMDYQFGMAAKNLDLSAPFGIKEIFEHPDRGIDGTLINRMLVGYGDYLKIISAPNELRLLPQVSPETVRDLIFTLREQYKYIIIDLPHSWSLWTATALLGSNHNVLVAQLWLRSVTHASRILNAWRESGIPDDAMSVAINRSGAKFKEAVSTKDFERVSGKTIDTHFVNDIKTVVEAENQGKTILESSPSLLSRQLREFALSFVPADAKADASGAAPAAKSNLSSLFNRK